MKQRRRKCSSTGHTIRPLVESYASNLTPTLNVRYLCVVQGADACRVFLHAAASDPDLDCAYRISPIFPVEPANVALVDLAAEAHLGFFCCLRPFSAIGHLLARFGNQTTVRGTRLSAHLWYSHGLAALVVIAPERELIERAREELGENCTAHEVWTVSNHCLVKQTHSVQVPASYEVAMADYSQLSAELVNDIDEFRGCIATALHRCAIYAGDLLPVLHSVLRAGNVVITALGRTVLERQRIAGPDSDAALGKIKALQQVENRLRSEIVQLNAALAYSISQWFSGCIPILHHECQIRNHSLLGVGNAYRGILCILYNVEQKFQTLGADSVIRSPAFEQAQGFDILKYPPRPLESWHGKGVDSSLGVAPGPARHLLVSYSGRRGFRESPHCITVPLEVLFCGVSPAWSLMTFSHEIVHAHVRGLLAAIFGDSNEELQAMLKAGELAPYFMTEGQFDSLVEEFRRLRQTSAPPTRRKCLQLAFINYCVLHSAAELLAREGGPGQRQAGVVPATERVFEVFKQQHRMINEILVHVLDYQYFYDGDEDLYIRLLWISWSIVPGVLERIDEYVMRTLCAVSSKGEGTVDERFDEAVEVVTARLQSLREHGSRPAINEALRMLGSAEGKKKLRIAFQANAYLVDVARVLLHSVGVHGELTSDSRVTGEGTGDYELGSGAFSTDNIDSPVAFVRAMLRRSLERASPWDDQARLTAWILLTCASANVT